MQMSLVCVMMNTSHIKLFPTRKGADTMKEKRRDNKGRICILERANEQTGNTYINM